MSVLTRPPIVTSGLVLHLDAANRKSYPGSGTTWFDMSGNNNSGSLVNGPVYSSNQGGSIVFDGVDDYATISHSPSLTGFSGLTISAWINKKSKDIKIAAKWIPVPGGSCFILRETSGILQFYTYTTAQAGGGIGINPTSGWKLYTATWDGQTMRAYLNAIASGTTYSQTGTIIGVNSNITIAAEYDLTFNSDASIANLQIYNRALSAQEVLQNYNAQKARFGLP